MEMQMLLKSPHRIARPLLEEVLLQCGPVDQVGRYLLMAESEMRRRGVYLSFGSFGDLVDANARNKDSWLSLYPAFDPRHNSLDPKSAFCILGRDMHGDVVLTHAARLYRWPTTCFAQEGTSLRYLYEDPTAQITAGETCAVTAPIAEQIKGNAIFTGAVWYRPDFRKKMLAPIMSRITRYLAFSLWENDLSFALMSKAVIAGGMPERCGMTKLDWAVTSAGSPLGSLTLGIVWQMPDETLSDLAHVLERPVDVLDEVVYRRRA
jgi:hypothetical protein